ncbi:hypothetical protein [Streptomyces sp. NPDC059398]|uniref:hypothetical protein n=1 Tax=Streptomyces sp. NPDC059398 TaxID=3346820 RepID=UPI0036CC3F7C
MLISAQDRRISAQYSVIVRSSRSGQSPGESGSVVDIDVHPIPANETKGEPEHQHIDFRFLFHTETADIGALQIGEVTDAAWLCVDALASRRLVGRVSSALR